MRGSIFVIGPEMRRKLVAFLKGVSWKSPSLFVLRTICSQSLTLRGGRAFPVLARFLAERDADYLDLGNAFPSGIHFARDSHIDDRGHHWVAEQIASWITGAFELPKGPRSNSLSRVSPWSK